MGEEEENIPPTTPPFIFPNSLFPPPPPPLYTPATQANLVGLMSLNVLVIRHFSRSRFKCSCFRATLLTVLRTPIGRKRSGLSSVLAFFRSSM